MKEIFRYPKIRDDIMMRLLEEGELEIKVDLDGVLLLAYGIVTAKGCRQELERTFTEPEKYYAKFEMSKYKDCNVGNCIPVEYLWKMRLIIGILPELRETRDESLIIKVTRFLKMIGMVRCKVT